MNDYFFLNGILWRIIKVDPYDERLIDRTHTLTVATTDPNTHCVYVSNEISGDFLARVLIHELSHACLFSFDLLSDVRRMARPECVIELEEFICNFLADYGRELYEITYEYLGEKALYYLPYHYERLIG